MNTNFKTALFGGFDREDVISYIQQTSRESQQRISALEEENRSLQERNRAMEAELSTLRQSVLENSAAADTCLQLQDQFRQLQEQAQKLRQETEDLRAQAAEYQSLKDHIADIEISAHRRTEEFRAKAIEELRTMARRQEDWCAQSRDKYAELNRQFWPSRPGPSRTWPASTRWRRASTGWRRASAKSLPPKKTNSNQNRRDSCRGDFLQCGVTSPAGRTGQSRRPGTGAPAARRPCRSGRCRQSWRCPPRR